MPSLQRAKEYLAQPMSADALPGLVVITGGTTGIGPAIARLLASKGCGRVIVVGRNEVAAEGVLSSMRTVNGGGQYEFVKGDLMTKKGMKGVCDALIERAGSKGIDVLIQTQNGVPSGLFDLTDDGFERGFAVQVLSRFFIPQYLSSVSALNPSAKIICLANAGVSLDDLDVDDLCLFKREGQYGRTRLFFQQSFRDSSVLDSFVQEMSEHDPIRPVYHVHPGLVKTPTFDTSACPWPIKVVMTLGLWTFASSPDYIAQIPAYLALADDKERAGEVGEGRLFDHTLKVIPPGKWVSHTANRKKAWDKLVNMSAE